MATTGNKTPGKGSDLRLSEQEKTCLADEIAQSEKFRYGEAGRSAELRRHGRASIRNNES